MKNKIRQINENEGKRNPAYKKILIVMSVIFSLYSLTLIFPFLWLVLNSLKTKQEFFSGNPFSYAVGRSGIEKLRGNVCRISDRRNVFQFRYAQLDLPHGFGVRYGVRGVYRG